MHRSQKFITLFVILILGLTALTACAKTGRELPERTIVYGVWPQVAGQLQSLYRIDDDGQNKAALAENASQLYLTQSITFHNYLTPQSFNGQYFVFYSLNESGLWGINIFDMTAGALQVVYTKDLEPTLVRFREGFSPNDRYYAYTYRNVDTGLFLVSVIDLSTGTALADITDAYFVDFTSNSNEVIYLGVGDAGSVTGIYKLSLPGEESTLIYTPPAEEQITFVTLSPDGKWLIFTDQTSLSLFRIPIVGGVKETIYEFTGTTMSVNYEPDGNYMVVLDLSQEAQTLKLFNSKLEEVTSVEPIGSGYLAFAADGRLFAYQLPVETQMVLYISDLEQDAVTTIDDSAQLYQPQFTRDGTQLLYIRYTDRASKFGELVLASVDGSVTSLVDQNVTSFQLRNDGSIVFMKYDQDAFTSTLIKVDAAGLNPLILDGPFTGTATITK